MSRGGLASSDVSERVAAIAELARSAGSPSEEEIEALLGCLADERKVVQRRAAECLAALAARGVEIEKRLVALLALGPPRARWGAAYALCAASGPRREALDTLLETLAIDDGDLRWAALDLVIRIAERDRAAIIERLIEIAETGAAVGRKMALYGLRGLDAREPRAVAAAESALSGRDIDLRLAALSAYARLSSDLSAAASRVASLVADGDERMRRAAAATLGTFGVRSPQVLSVLREAAAGADPSLGRAAERSLRLLSDS